MKGRKTKTVSPPAAAVAPPVVTRRSIYLYTACAILALVGLADAIYLTVEHMAGRVVQCTITTGCNEVLTSGYAAIAGVPLAGIGAFAYFAAFSLAILAVFGNQTARTLLFYLVALMFAFTIWLFFVQAFVLHAFCQFCLLSGAVTLLLMLIVAADRFFLRRANGV
jgi:uncharacterized membrane protein